MASLDPINSMFSPAGLTPGFDPTNIPGSFGNVFNQAMSQSTSPADKAKVQWLQTQYMKQNILYDMFSDSKTSVLGFGMSDLFGVGGAFGLPSWVYDAQRVLGNDPGIQHLLDVSQQASQIAQSRFNNNLSSMGLGGGVDSMF